MVPRQPRRYREKSRSGRERCPEIQKELATTYWRERGTLFMFKEKRHAVSVERKLVSCRNVKMLDMRI
jgi:hypothetical protein